MSWSTFLKRTRDIRPNGSHGNWMKNTPFGRVTRSIRWLRLALFGMVPLLILLVGGLYWGVQRIVAEQQEKLTVHFSLMSRTIGQHERFLWRLQDENARLAALRFGDAAFLQQQPLPSRPGWRMFRGQAQGVHLPFSLICAARDCPDRDDDTWGAGQYLSDTFTSFWSTSSVPSGDAFLLDLESYLSIAAPGIGAGEASAPMTEARFLAVDARIRQALVEQTGVGRRYAGPAGRDILWLQSADLPDMMIGVVRAPIPAQTWHGAAGRPAEIHVATLLRFERTAIYEAATGKPSYDDIWLTHRDRYLLVGGDSAPSIAEPESGSDRPVRAYTADGLVFHFKSRNGQWDAYYRIGYARLFSDSAGLGVAAVVLLLLGLAAAVGYGYWYERRVVAPAERDQRDLMDSEAFNRTIIATTPVALGVLRRDSGRLLFGNPLARQWLDLAEDGEAATSPTLERLREQLAGRVGAGTLDGFSSRDGAVLQVAYAPTRYRKQDVILCAFTDISARAEIERTLERSRRDADRASAAKSTFLATMSHEIRTPLYGVLGTLELLELTPLGEEQRRYLATIKSSSAILLQLISDILDTTRIETGQMVLESEAFSPRQLVEDAVSAYAAMAWQKQLLLFASIDPDIPAALRGDPGRISQILNNLISNAIKFTGSGHVIVRLQSRGEREGKARIGIEVADTGAGIDAEHRARLFEPFYQIDAGEHEFRGAGLGLSICMQLAKLMGGRIELDSAPGAGSCFSLELALEREPEGDAQAAPDLSGIRLQVRAAHPELAENTCRWLRRWGADARLADPSPLASTPDDVLVDVMLADATPPPSWKGRHMVAASALAMPLSAGTADANRLDSIANVIAAHLRGEPVAVDAQAVGSLPEPLRMKVLIAEDNPINRATLAHQLHLLGCTVTSATDGAEALVRWREQGPFDVVLTDVNMPRLNGYGLARAIREENGRVRIIGVTANAMREEEAKCRDAGMNAWLVKPIGLRALYRHLRGDALKPATAPEPLPDSDETQLPSRFTGLFNEAMRDDIARARDALAAHRSGDLLATLHRMRGAMAMMRMADLIARFEQLEERIRGDGLDERVDGDVEAALRSLETALMAP